MDKSRKTKKTKKDAPPKKVIFRKRGNVTFRPVEESDVSYLHRWANDQDVTRFLTLYMPMNENDEKDWVQRIRADGKNIVFMIEFAEEGSSCLPVGTVGLHGINNLSRTASLGIMIGEKEYWGKAIGENAIHITLEYAFHTINIRKVHLSVFSENKRAKRLYKKCGFKVEGVLKEHHFRDGKYANEIRMAIFQSDWVKLQK